MNCTNFRTTARVREVSQLRSSPTVFFQVSFFFLPNDCTALDHASRHAHIAHWLADRAPTFPWPHDLLGQLPRPRPCACALAKKNVWFTKKTEKRHVDHGLYSGLLWSSLTCAEIAREFCVCHGRQRAENSGELLLWNLFPGPHERLTRNIRDCSRNPRSWATMHAGAENHRKLPLHDRPKHKLTSPRAWQLQDCTGQRQSMKTAE